MTKTLVTSYPNPDLDGTACAYAYAEYLRKMGNNAVAAVFGKPHLEAQFVLDKYKIDNLEDADNIIQDCKNVILVDSSDLKNISNRINPKDVVEVIDHRKVNEAEKFPKAKIQIEYVGSAATLITEKFKVGKLKPSKRAAVLLFSAIVSNTINFKAKVTTQRDKNAARWLKTYSAISKNYIHEMFKHKSVLTKPVKQILLDDFTLFIFKGKRMGIAQLEVINANTFVQKNLTEIKKSLTQIKKEKRLDFTFLTCIDIEKATNILVAIDDNTRELLKNSVGVGFEDNIARRDEIIMRKELVPLIKKVIEH
jgi:manganese-dependent inorganic pyrophosphatase